jgi:hypothetical protein
MFVWVVVVACLFVCLQGPSHGCTFDQTYDDATAQCLPLDCVSRYAGDRNYHNAVMGVCEPTAICIAEQLYDPSNNQCTDPQDPPPLNNTDSTAGDDEDDGTEPGAAQTLSCGEHGQVASATATRCVCDTGWETDLAQQPQTFHWCTLFVGVTNTTHTQQPHTGGTNSGATALVAFVVFLLIGLCVAWALYAVVRAYRAHKKQTDTPLLPLDQE